MIDSEDIKKYLSITEKQQLSSILRSIEISKELEGNKMVDEYRCPNCGLIMVENEPGILQCMDVSCEQKMMKEDYGVKRIILVDSCWSCPEFYDGITRACKLTDKEISCEWRIDPSCPLKRMV